ncbi:cysteine proteinase [Tilletiaria anomala UBC 951]|uniref:Cysteine proteinase n=1 Tax=Tilletiaria anomala (strain ATCC 24038 / CBS 436.72 / UBC 951) TaxID=1037660 RepID=A0A066VCX8_TILAU|nr:cysteine proteinase [Tilletiaria anomala UBC 951]KDN36415.1 cysteine proteinase [Tilletiaria anomala UBC 951]
MLEISFVFTLLPSQYYQRKVVERHLLRERDARSSIGPSKWKQSDLTDEQEATVDNAFSKRGVVSTITGAEVNHSDLAKLRPRQWLNDESINFHGLLVLNRSKQAFEEREKALKAGKKPDVQWRAFWDIHFFNSFFYAKLEKAGYSAVKRWTRKVHLFSKDIVLFPVNLGNAHWVTGAINFRLKRIEYYDSMHTSNRSFFLVMREYLEEESLDKRKTEMDWTGWQDYTPTDFPYQSNGYDCGVFTISTIEQLTRDGAAEDDEDYAWNFTERNMPYLRRRTVYEIVKKQLLE